MNKPTEKGLPQAAAAGKSDASASANSSARRSMSAAGIPTCDATAAGGTWGSMAAQPASASRPSRLGPGTLSNASSASWRAPAGAAPAQA